MDLLLSSKLYLTYMYQYLILPSTFCYFTFNDFAGYSQLEFREELVRQLGDIGDDVPLYRPSFHNDFIASHMPVHVEGRVNCRVCYIINKSEVKCSWTCSNSLCQDLGVNFA